MSDIKIKITAGSTQATSSARATGSLKHFITEHERAIFGIRDADLKRKVGSVMGREPNEAYVRNPAPWDGYNAYGWDQVETVLTPIETKILSVDTEPTIVYKMEFKNESDKKGTFSGKLSKQVSTTVGTSWSQSSTLSFNQEIKYDIGFLGTGAGGSTSFGFQKQWGKSTEESRTTTLGTEAGVSVELEPGEKVVAELCANSSKMKVRITYEAHLTGQTAVKYHRKFKGHYLWGPYMSNVLRGSNSVEVTEDIEIKYYDEARVTIKNPAGDKLKPQREL